MITTISAFLAIGFGLAFAQTARLGFLNKFTTYSSLLQLPGLGVALYATWVGFQWWTIALFVCISIFVGVMHGIFIRNHGRSSLLQMQGIYAGGFDIASLACAISLFF